MPVRAKFKCTDKEVNSNGAQIRMEPVISGSAENEEFYRYTPGGVLMLGTINEAAAEQFEEGKEYYIDISPAE